MIDIDKLRPTKLALPITLKNGVIDMPLLLTEDMTEEDIREHLFSAHIPIDED